MALPGNQQKAIELVNKLLRIARFVREVFPFCSQKLSAERIVVQSSIKLF
jgi:hypothetical protein